MSLTDAVHQEIQALCKQGDALRDADKHKQAEMKYLKALSLVPEPKRDYSSATWINVALGDLHFELWNYGYCFDYFIEAVQCFEGLGNPFIHLRLGQMYFEFENLRKAADELTRAYMGGGEDIFRREKPKYFAFLKTQIEI